VGRGGNIKRRNGRSLLRLCTSWISRGAGTIVYVIDILDLLISVVVCGLYFDVQHHFVYHIHTHSFWTTPGREANDLKSKMPRPATPHLSNRLRQLSLNSPPQTALFYARLYNSLCPLENDHESVHILALCLLEVGETYSSLHVVRDRADMGCSGCAMILARCCQKLGRFSEGQAALQRAMSRGTPLSESGFKF